MWSATPTLPHRDRVPQKIKVRSACTPHQIHRFTRETQLRCLRHLTQRPEPRAQLVG
jgi:hypothetical protein